MTHAPDADYLSALAADLTALDQAARRFHEHDPHGRWPVFGWKAMSLQEGRIVVEVDARFAALVLETWPEAVEQRRAPDRLGDVVWLHPTLRLCVVWAELHNPSLVSPLPKGALHDHRG